MNDRKAVLVAGAGDATGGAIARRFAREGYVACVTRRHEDKLQPLVEQIRAARGTAHAFGSDARREQGVKDRLKATTEEAVARGVFGAPTFFVGAAMFWGQDRLEFVDEALARAATS